MLTEQQKQSIQRGYSYTVDNGYSSITSIEQIMTILEMDIEALKREMQITTRDIGAPAEFQTRMLESNEARFRNLSMRIKS